MPRGKKWVVRIRTTSEQENDSILQVKTEAVTALKQIMLDNSLLSGHW